MMKRRVAIQLLTLMVMAPAVAVADNLPPLPVPHFTDAPKSMPEGPARTVHFSFAATPQTTASGYELSDHVQQWYCQPGKDIAPTDTSIHTEPFGGGQAPCQLEENWSGVSSSSGSIMFPIRGESHLDPGTVYVRVQLRWANQGGTTVKAGGWSAWHRTLVEDTHRAVFTGAKGMSMKRRPPGSLNIKVDMSGAKPPAITTPKAAQVFHGGPQISFSGSVAPHKPGSVWTCCDIQWKRALIVMPENNAYIQTHNPGHTAFPSTPSPWQGTDTLGMASGVKETSPSFHGYWYYSNLRPHDHSFGYRYWFRVREYYWPAGLGGTGLMAAQGYPGPWSAWRSFDVQEPLMAATPNHNVRMLPGAHMAKPSSGQQQNSGQHNTRRVAPMPMMRLK